MPVARGKRQRLRWAREAGLTIGMASLIGDISVIQVIWLVVNDRRTSATFR